MIKAAARLDIGEQEADCCLDASKGTWTQKDRSV